MAHWAVEELVPPGAYQRRVKAARCRDGMLAGHPFTSGMTIATGLAGRPSRHSERIMNPLTPAPDRRVEVIADWAITLTRGTQLSLARIDHTLSRAAERIAVVRAHLTRRRVGRSISCSAT